jgi:predicted DNA-binding antitoxin AbrB/MazE fold protein
MAQAIEAVYENGVLRPKEPMAFTEGETVDILVLPRAKRRPAEILAEIAALPGTGKDDGVHDVSENHDRYLYGEDPA